MDLRGKDYLAEKEAAHYCCVSITQFRSKMTEYCIAPLVFMGKKVYRRHDLQQAIEHGRGWQRSTKEGRAGTYNIQLQTVKEAKKASVRLARLKQK